MDPKAFAAAQEQLALAKMKLAAMKAAKSLDELAHLWTEFLTELHRVYLRLRKATEHGPGKGWFDQILYEQRNDELLKYLLHARDAREHGIEKITAKSSHSFAMTMKKGSGPVVINWRTTELEIIGDRDTLNKVTVEFIPGAVHLVAVTDRSDVFQPPTQHLGQPLNNPSPISAAELGVAYLERQCAHAAANFAPKVAQ